MVSVRQQQPTFQFGVFEFHPRTGELRKQGVKLKLQEQPTQILTLLLEHSGEVVTREEIQKHLWPEGTYVDFDNAINSAIRKLRDALGDSPENPRFVETLARRGYRFIAPRDVRAGESFSVENSAFRFSRRQAPHKAATAHRSACTESTSAATHHSVARDGHRRLGGFRCGSPPP